MVGGSPSNEMPPAPVRTLPAPTPFGTLVVIPTEIRLKIYRSVIEQGQMAILRTCRAINEEAFDNLYKYAVCRVEFNYHSGLAVYSSRAPWSRIQNLEFRVLLIDDHSLSCIFDFNEWLQCFNVLMTDLKTCKIRLNSRPVFIFISENFPTFKGFTAFRKMTLEIAVNSAQDATGMHLDIYPQKSAMLANSKNNKGEQEQEG
ncbi:MAG: hypothetical protein ALECFALPRED_008977 [Alectoria fallacina]|uniref:Uncharacterized protein n=1 Tax=Alectoria fallacina TaxID=1903189 RepID=A0A8H3PHN8_9LECA|nr:MAG: hypothetical protein ALECFALPRED_008977 [Alectoria fallacina]